MFWTSDRKGLVDNISLGQLWVGYFYSTSTRPVLLSASQVLILENTRQSVAKSMSLYLALAISGVGPTLYIIMESDLRTLCHRNLLCNMLMSLTSLFPSRPNSDIGLHDAFSHICNWAKDAQMQGHFICLYQLVVLNRLMSSIYWVFCFHTTSASMPKCAM